MEMVWTFRSYGADIDLGSGAINISLLTERSGQDFLKLRDGSLTLTAPAT